jgi:hypothetical protein
MPCGEGNTAQRALGAREPARDLGRERRLTAQPQDLHEQPAQRLEMALPEVADGAKI